MALACEYEREHLPPKIHCIDTSVAVEFDNDTEMVLNVIQIGDMHCEH